MADFYRREIFAIGHFLTNLHSYRYQEVYQKLLSHLQPNRFGGITRSNRSALLGELSAWARETFLTHPPSTLWELTCLSPQLANYWLKQTLPQGNYPRPELVLDELAHLPNGFRVSCPLDDIFLWNSVNRLLIQSRPILEDRLIDSPTQPTTINLVLLQTLPNLLVTRKELKQFYGTPTNAENTSAESSYEWQPNTSPVQQWQFGELLAAGGSRLTYNPAWLKAIGLLELSPEDRASVIGDEHVCRLCQDSEGDLTCQRCQGRRTWACDYCYDGWQECDMCGATGCDECWGEGGWNCEECDDGQAECSVCITESDEPNECPFKRFEKFWGQTVLETLVLENPALNEATRLETVESLFNEVPATLERLTTGQMTPHLLDLEAAEDLVTRGFAESLESDWMLFIPATRRIGFEILYLPRFPHRVIRNKKISQDSSNYLFSFTSYGYGFGAGRMWATGWGKAEQTKTFLPGSSTGHTYCYSASLLKATQESRIKQSLNQHQDFEFLALELRPDLGVRSLNFPQSS